MRIDHGDAPGQDLDLDCACGSDVQTIYRRRRTWSVYDDDHGFALAAVAATEL